MHSQKHLLITHSRDIRNTHALSIIRSASLRRYQLCLIETQPIKQYDAYYKRQRTTNQSRMSSMTHGKYSFPQPSNQLVFKILHNAEMVRCIASLRSRNLVGILFCCLLSNRKRLNKQRKNRTAAVLRARVFDDASFFFGFIE